MLRNDLTKAEDASCVLIVCPSRSDFEPYFGMASELPANVIHAETCDAARGILDAQPGHDVVLSSLTLPDGNWQCVHRAMVEHNDPACLVVVAPGTKSDHLVEELAARGALGLFTEPSSEDARAILSGAWCEGRANRLAKRPEAAAVDK